MDYRATATWDVRWELDHPLKVVNFLKHLHDDIVSDVAEKLLIVDRDFGKFREKVVRHEDGSRSVAPLLSCLCFRLDVFLWCDTACHVLGLVHALEVGEV